MSRRCATWASLAFALIPLFSLAHAQRGYQLAGGGISPVIQVCSSDFKGVQRAAGDLGLDFGRATGANATVDILDKCALPGSSDAPLILAGTIGRSDLIDSLVQGGKLDVSAARGQWESYVSQVVESPTAGVDWALVIAGSDQRGTIYGLYDVSDQLGVSPWHWWGDVPTPALASFHAREAPKRQTPPSVKYRGLFINDEQPAITNWAKDKFGYADLPFRPEFYALFFELLLRLRGNYFWPAMWGSAFYVDGGGSGPLADDFGVVVGTSHHEPMARAEREQQTVVDGPWDWVTNRENIVDFFRAGIERSESWETYYTMGMRGAGDAESPTLTPESLEEIIKVQQGLLREILHLQNVSSVPQTWVLYKEVGRYYQAGLEVPDDITLLWTDDNWGNLMRTPLANETERTGGAGVYYHFDYVGGVRSYKWINTIQLVKTWEQMHMAYEHDARQLWLVNVGDIKPMEAPISHFMAMAYDMSEFSTPDSTDAWLRGWAAATFGPAIAGEAADILHDYGMLLASRKYELLSNLPYAFSVTNYDEVEHLSRQWHDLHERAAAASAKLDADAQVAFFEMVLWQVRAGKTVVDLYNTAATNAWYAAQNRVSANALAVEAHELFAEDAANTQAYHDLLGGKWNHMGDQTHIGYDNWQQPETNVMPPVAWVDGRGVGAGGAMGVAIQGKGPAAGGSAASRMLLPVDPYMPESETRWFEIFAQKNQTFGYRAVANESYVTLSRPKGVISAPGEKSDARVEVTVDWDDAPAGLSVVAIQVSSKSCNGTSTPAVEPVTLLLPVNKTEMDASFSGHVESNGVVSIEAEHYAQAGEANGLSYVTIPHYGRTLSGVKIWPASAASQTPESAPALTYPFYTFTEAGTAARLVVYLASTWNHDPSRPLRFAFSVDGAEPEVVQPVPDTPMGMTPVGWEDMVTRGGWISTSAVHVAPGAHELKIWMLEPGTLVQKMAVDLGGLRQSALGPPESMMV